MAAIFICFVFFAWYLYLRRERAYALTIFFFFITSGFQLIPEEMMNLMPGFSKGQDYAVILLLGCLVSDFIFSRNYFKRDMFVNYLGLFFLFLLVCIFYSKFKVGCSWYEIIQTIRQYFLFLAYFVFRHMNKDELAKLLKILFIVTLFISVLYISQTILNTEILISSGSTTYTIGDWKFHRYYNQPSILFFMVFMGLYKSPFKGLPRILSITVLCLAVLMGFSRSAISLFMLSLILAYVLRLPKVKQVKVFVIATAILVPAIAIIGHNFVKSRTFVDMKLVLSGDLMDIDLDFDDWETFQNSTFSYRIGHLFERITYLTENPDNRLLGVGLFPESSPKVDQFEFFLGLTDEKGNKAQIETPDISYSALVLRFGYLGTTVYLMIYFYLIYYFFKRKNNLYAFISFLFLFYSFGVSFFCNNLLLPVTYLPLFLTLCLVNKEEKGEEPISINLEESQ